MLISVKKQVVKYMKYMKIQIKCVSTYIIYMKIIYNFYMYCYMIT